MLRIGLSGGIGAGKSTVSSTFSELGGVVVDGDVISREVVQPGTEGLAKLVEAFGEEILQEDGSLNRPALAAVAFSDDDKRATLNGIVHPLVGARRQELIEAAADDAVIIEDIPLLVESQMAPMFPLVVIVHADEDVRIARLIEHRGFTDADARARIAAQATEEQRRAVADVWLDNAGTAADLAAAARALWDDRIEPFADNLRAGRPASTDPVLVPADPTWPEQARRIVARLTTTCGHHAVRIDHVGSTAVPGLDAKDVIDVQVTVADLDVADELADALASAGYPRVADVVGDEPHSGDESAWAKRLHASADPGRPTNVHLRVDGLPNQLFALVFRDWLRADPDVRAEYLELKREVAAAGHADTGAYADAKEPWFGSAYDRAIAWADATGWAP
ncbi:dephospho-CoA kinase [Mycolicibacterium sediminis]|uniref:Dephospho-CoA kinase n=1 Tax=Mycolicibacterium sediminis TaxID=1286180 RepID=A0A7I7QU43_9MYCO|nr:dephospho-CoA kinase [Mycolicibacterium sediminis]BBY29853.1 dephospho-CoA kinase [Mycolicibacterium sediminis]